MEAVQKNKKLPSPHQTFLDYNRVHFKQFYKDILSNPKRYKKVQPGLTSHQDNKNNLRLSFQKQKGSSSDINFSSLDISQISGKSQPASMMKQSYFDKTNLHQSQISKSHFLNRSTDQEPNTAILMEKKPKGKNIVDMMAISKKPQQSDNIIVAKQQKPIIEESQQKLQQKGEYSSEANNNSKQLNVAYSKVSLSSNLRKQGSQQNSHISKQKSQSSRSKTSNNNILGFYNQMTSNQLSAKQDHRPTESKTLQIQKKDEVVSKIKPTQNLDKLRKQSQISKNIVKKQSQESDESSDDSRDFDSIIAQKNKIKAQSSVSNSQSQQIKVDNKNTPKVKSQDESFFTIEVDKSQNKLSPDSAISQSSKKNQQNISKQKIDSGQKPHQKINSQKTNNQNDKENYSDSEKSYDQDDEEDFDSLLSKKVNSTVKSLKDNQIFETKIIDIKDSKQPQNQKGKLQTKEINQDNPDQDSDDDSDKSFGTIQKSFSMKQQILSNTKQLNSNKQQSKTSSDQSPKQKSIQKVQAVQVKQPEEQSSSQEEEDYESKLLKKTVQQNQQNSQHQQVQQLTKIRTQTKERELNKINAENQPEKFKDQNQGKCEKNQYVKEKQVQVYKETDKAGQNMQNSQKRRKSSSEHSFEEQSASDQQQRKQFQSRITEEKPDDKNTQNELIIQKIIKQSPSIALQPIQSNEQQKLTTSPNQSPDLSNQQHLQTFLNQAKTFFRSSFLSQITNSITQSVKNQMKQLISIDFRSSIVKEVSQIVTKQLKQQIKAQKQLFYYEFKEMIVEEISEQFTQLRKNMKLQLIQVKNQIKCEIHQEIIKSQQPKNVCQARPQNYSDTMQKNQINIQISEKQQLQQENNVYPIFSSPDIRVIQDLKKDITAEIVSSLGSEVKQFMRQEFRGVFKSQVQSFLQFQTQRHFAKEQTVQQSNALINKSQKQQFTHAIQNEVQQKQVLESQIIQALQDTENNVLKNQITQQKTQQNQSASNEQLYCNRKEIQQSIEPQPDYLQSQVKQIDQQTVQNELKHSQTVKQVKLEENEQKESDLSSEESFDQSQ